jgi:ABC-2 type transport system ATP-binding protein
MDAAASPLIELNAVTVRYGKFLALDELSLTARAGEIYGFLGRNGAGKTTTMRVLMGVLKPVAGEIRLFNESMKRVPVAIKRRIGYVSQEQHFYPWMNAEQLGRFVGAFYPTWDDTEYKRLLQVLDIPHRRRTAELSGGTRTKLGLALALAPRPPLLLLDEPTTGLDPVARREFNDLVVAMVAERGVATFFSSHLVDDVESIATRVGIIQSGRMRIEGKVSELVSRVRRVKSTPEVAMPTEFHRVRGDIWEAEPDVWAASAWAAETVIETLPLEEIFLAYARTDAVLSSAA